MKANKYIGKFIATLDKLDQQGQRIPGLILSHAGFGKTSTIKMYCKTMDYNLVTIIPSQNASDDILGIQSVDTKTGKLKRLTPSWYNKLIKTMENGKRTILFIDEISTCDAYIQGPLLNLIFERSLGEETLPDNVFIVAAGNYSIDLNNEFKMTAPLVNRFLLLNLSSDDYSITEVLNGSFDKVCAKGHDAMVKYLDIAEDDDKSYNYESFKEWVKSSKEVGMKSTQYYESFDDGKDYGIIGFTSVRSLSYCMKFAESYMGMYNDSIWTRIVGDTLGTSSKRINEGNVIFLRDILNSVVDSFMRSSNDSSNSLADVCSKCTKKGTVSPEELETIRSIIRSTNGEDLSEKDYKSYADFATMFWQNEEIASLTDELAVKTDKI